MGVFDPYHTWLGIPPEDQPPNHYRLLGIRVGEDNERVIADAADRQTVHLRTKQHSEHVAESQRLLNEVARARVCLLNPTTRAAYQQSIAPPAVATPLTRAVTSRTVKRNPKNPLAEVAKVVVGGLAGIAIAAVLVRWIYGRIDAISEQKAAAIVAKRPDPPPSVQNGNVAAAQTPLPPSVTASLLKIYNSSNGHRGTSGTNRVNVVLTLAGDIVWRQDNIETVWEPKGSPLTSVPLPSDIPFDTLRVEITELHPPHGSLSELEVYASDGTNIAASQSVTASSFYLSKSTVNHRDWRPYALTDGIITSAKYGAGYWVAAADDTASWIEIKFTGAL